MRKARPRTGEARETNQPLKIDRMPSYVHDAILFLRNQAGKTWLEIEERSAEKYSPDWMSMFGKPKKRRDAEDGAEGEGRGFVDWDSLPFAALELFPEMRIPHTTLHRWYDLRVEQVQRDALIRAKSAQQITRAFAKAGIVNDDEAVMNAARDQLMGVLAEDGTESGRLNATKGLIKLAEVMHRSRTNKLRERKVIVEEQTLQMKLDLLRRKAGELIVAAEGAEAGAPALTREEIIAGMKEVYGVV